MNWKEDGAVYEGRNKKSKAVSRSLDPLIRYLRTAKTSDTNIIDL